MIKIEKIREDHESQMDTKTMAFERKMIEAAEQSRNSIEASSDTSEHGKRGNGETYVRFYRSVKKKLKLANTGTILKRAKHQRRS